MSDISDDKRALRAQAIAARRLAHQLDGAGAAARVAALALSAVPFARGAIVAGYWPIGEELDVRPLLSELAARGHVTSLPVVTARRASLIFRRWREGDGLEPGAHGILAPSSDAPTVDPDVLIVPLVAFDASGYRLGYGGGYYDRTLASLRASKKILAVGVGFAVQEFPRLPRGPDDQRLDWIVSEIAARPIDANR
jgi:5-formyltetrahydrofolate cyclo-ligase